MKKGNTEIEKISFDDWPTSFKEFIVEAIWPRRLVIRKASDNIINLLGQEGLLKKAKILHRMNKIRGIERTSRCCQPFNKLLPNNKFLVIVRLESNTLVRYQLFNQVPSASDRSICIKNFCVCVSQLSPFYSTSLPPVGFLLVKKTIEFGSENFSKIPFSKGEISIIPNNVNEQQNIFDICDICLEGGNAFLPVSEDFPQVFKFCRDILSLISLIGGYGPAMTEYYIPISLLILSFPNPISFPQENMETETEEGFFCPVLFHPYVHGTQPAP